MTGGRFVIGDLVRKKVNSEWRGEVVGYYSTENTPNGYSVKSLFEKGSVQVWPEAALESWDGKGTPEQLQEEIDKLKAMVFTQGSEAAKATYYWSERCKVLEAALRELGMVVPAPPKFPNTAS